MDNASDMRDYRKGAKLIKRGALEGCPHAHYIMGSIYLHDVVDTGIAPSIPRAKEHFKASADLGHPHGKAAHEQYGKSLSCSALIAIAVVIGVVVFFISKAF